MVDLSAQELPEPDALIGAPHPRFALKYTAIAQLKPPFLIVSPQGEYIMLG